MSVEVIVHAKQSHILVALHDLDRFILQFFLVDVQLTCTQFCGSGRCLLYFIQCLPDI